jgi:hypothetical protein
MSFDLDDRGAEELDAIARRDGVPFGTGAEPGFFSGTGTAALQGLARGTVAKPALLLGDAATPLLRTSAQAADKALGTSLDAWLTEQQTRNTTALEQLRSDPATTGFAGQVVGGLFDLGSSAILYTPEGAAVLEGYGRRQELIGQGVAPGTATAVGAVSGAATYVGVKAPITLGQQAIGQGGRAMAQNLAYGATASVAGGVAERGFSRDLLKAAGYGGQAALLEPYDKTALAAEATLGALFSGGAAALHARSTVRGQAATDAALTVTTVDHAQRGTAPGTPTDARAASAHASALSTAIEQVLRNEPANVGEQMADTAFVRPVPSPEIRAEVQAHVADLLPVGSAAAPRAFKVPAGAARGVRNNNPGNIEAGGTQWQGQVGSDGRFATFETPEAGIRALGRNLLTYQEKHGLNTVHGIINRWAPAGENDTAAYVRAVSTAVGVGPAEPLNLRDPSTLQKLTSAIIRHENGGQPYPDEVLRAGVELAIGGRIGEVVTERGMRVPFRYRVAEADRLVTSNDADLRPNAAYPAELQPRDRTRDASEAQIARIAGNLQPELLAESARASDGAPIIGLDGVVESGNGRMLALGRAYGGERGAEYRAWLEGNAERFGLDAADVRTMQRPVLARERIGDVDRAEFARQANESSVAAMSPTEQARADAGRISDLSGLVTAEDGTINQAQSAAFLRQFVQANVGPNEMGSVLQADGRISQTGLQRVRQAVFSKAYGDAELVAMLTESTDSNVRNVLAGLMRAAPAVARLQDLATAGARAPVDLGASIGRAAREFAALRAQGRTVEQALEQNALFDGMSPDMQALLKGIAQHANAPKRLGEMVGRLVDAVDALGDPRQRGIFDEAPGRLEPAAIDRAVARDVAAAARSTDPTMRAAAEVAMASPDMRVVLEDGTEVSAREVLARADQERQQAANDSAAFDAAVNCFLRT